MTPTTSEIPSITARRPQAGDLVILGAGPASMSSAGMPGMYLIDHVDLDSDGKVSTYYLRTLESTAEWGKSTTGFPPSRIKAVFANMLEPAG